MSDFFYKMADNRLIYILFLLAFLLHGGYAKEGKLKGPKADDGAEAVTTYWPPEVNITETLNLGSGASGDVTSPGYPSDYPSNLYQLWTVTAPAGHSLSIDVVFFSTEQDYDIVRVYEGETSSFEDSFEIAVYSGSAPPDFGIPYNYMWIKFTSDESFVQTGYRWTITAVDCSTGSATTEAPTESVPEPATTQPPPPPVTDAVTTPPSVVGCTRPEFGDPYGISLVPDQEWYAEFAAVEVVCDDDYARIGAYFTYCQSDGWSPDVYATTCNAPCDVTSFIDTSDMVATTSNGTQQDWYESGENAWFYCTAPGQLVGPDSSTCQNGTFELQAEQEVPYCEIYCPAPNMTTGTSYYTQQPLVEDEVDPFYRDGVTVRFSCDVGYLNLDCTIPGACTSTCDDGTWDPSTFPSCIDTGLLTTSAPGTHPTNPFPTMSASMPPMTSGDRLFVVDLHGSILVADITQTKVTELDFVTVPLINVAAPMSVTFDGVTGTLFWTESAGLIRSGRTDGSNPSTTLQIGYSFGIAIDTANRKLYWTDYEYDTIASANLDGSGDEVVIGTDLHLPAAIVIDSDKGAMIWSQIGNPPRIEAAFLDGSSRYVVVNDGIDTPNGLAFNEDGSRLYWVDNGYDHIESINPWTVSGRSIVYQATRISPFNLAIFGSETLWSDSVGSLGYYNTSLSEHADLYSDDFLYPMGMYVYRALNGSEVIIPTQKAVTHSRETTADTTQFATTESVDDLPTAGPAPPNATDLVCDSVSMTFTIDRSLLGEDGDAGDIHFVDESCVGYDHDDRWVAITTQYDRCGTTQEQTDDHIAYTNTVTYFKASNPTNGSNIQITRDDSLHIPVTCYLDREQILSASYLASAGQISFEEVSYGQYALTLERYANESFDVLADNSGVVDLGDPLYFGVYLTAVTDLTLLIDECWATPSSYPLDEQRYNMIVDGCGVDHTIVFYNDLGPVLKGFQVDAFAFIGDYDQVYIHCSVLICDNTDENSRCAAGCPATAKARRSARSSGTRSRPRTISHGPLSSTSHVQVRAKSEEAHHSSTVMQPVMLFAVGALSLFVLILVLVVVLTVRMRSSRPEADGYQKLWSEE